MPDSVERTSKHTALVSAPSLKLVIGVIATLCAVLSPRLIAALTAPDQSDITFTFVTVEYTEVALAFSVLIGLVVAILEWRVPRTPRDTFMTTLGVPAILAGALTANQGATDLQQAHQKLDKIATTMLQNNDIPVEGPAGSAPASEGSQSLLRLPFVATVYAQAPGAQPLPVASPAASRLSIVINQPRYFVVLDRASTQGDAQARLATLTRNLNAAAPGHAPKVEIKSQAGVFLVVVSGGPLAKSDAALQAVALKNAYHVAPALVQAM